LQENIDLATANDLVALPRTICTHPDSGADISLNISKFGLYLKCENKTANLNKVENPLDIDSKQALELISKAKAKKIVVKNTLKTRAAKPRKSIKKLTR
jgi:DNA topoisomerase-1